jgi:hypothetical protein
MTAMFIKTLEQLQYKMWLNPIVGNHTTTGITLRVNTLNMGSAQI